MTWTRTLMILAVIGGFSLLWGCDDTAGGDSGTDILDAISDAKEDGAEDLEDQIDPGDTPGDGADQDLDEGVDVSDSTDEDTNGCSPDRICGIACCEEGSYCINGSCLDECSSGVTCGPTLGLCCPTGDSCRDDGTCGLVCEGDRPTCGEGILEKCCEAGEVCLEGRCELDCGALERCGDLCCTEDQMCHEGACVAQCDDPARLCGESQELCCENSEICLGDTCIVPGDACVLSEECELEEYCEPTLGVCVPRELVEVCEYRPPVGEFSPHIGCRWRPVAGDPYFAYDDVVMTPAVANLTDDNGDGVTDELDIPDVVFTSFDYQSNGCCTTNGILRIVSGGCDADGNMPLHYSLPTPWIDNSGGIAIGNLDPDTDPNARTPEIVATGRTGAVALRRVADDGSDWEILWHNTSYPSNGHTRGGATPVIADLDANGSPEVIIGNLIFDGQLGTLIMDGSTLGSGLGVGNNAFLGPSSTVADIDLDGIQEVIAGNTVYEWDGSASEVECSYTFNGDNSGCGGSIPCDGFNAVGNFDADPYGEIVIVRLGQILILEHDCTEKLVINVPYDTGGLGDGACSRNESGPPTIADFDGDGFPEIGTAGADFYVVADLDCVGDPLPEECDSEHILWKALNYDCSSRATASSVFDFEGDGKAEVVYADERYFRIFDGTNGEVLYPPGFVFGDPRNHSSNTRIEMPVVVDVDNDGKSEILIPEPNASADEGGIEVWEDADNNWVRTRRIWNQHAYHVTNITEDGQVPRSEDPNWLNSRLNNFRQNVQPAGLFDAPDLSVASLDVTYELCSNNSTLKIVVEVGNEGALGVPPGIDVYAEVILESGETYPLGVSQTTELLLPGQTTEVIFEWTPPIGLGRIPFTVGVIVDDDGQGQGQYNECEEGNNEFLSSQFFTCDVS